MPDLDAAPQMSSDQKQATQQPPAIRTAGTDFERITVCARPFRATGPRIEHERLGDKHIIHNYGHGGSGWSLSWGSALLARDLAFAAADGALDIAVIGCGALGLTTARALQNAGARVTIYARDWPPHTRSSWATGSWTPDSRIALANDVDSTFARRWEAMTRASFAAFLPYTQQPQPPVAWTPRYVLSDDEPDPVRAAFVRQDTHRFFHLISGLDGLTPSLEALTPADNPWRTRFGWRAHSLTFQVFEYQQQLLDEFRAHGGQTQTRDFHASADLQTLPQRVIVHCTGLGARALFGDTNLTPVRGQIAWLAADDAIDYGILLDNLNVLGRHDGIVVQLSEQGHDTGWNDSNEAHDATEAAESLRQLRALEGRRRSL